jgi:hypothetical protein
MKKNVIPNLHPICRPPPLPAIPSPRALTAPPRAGLNPPRRALTAPGAHCPTLPGARRPMLPPYPRLELVVPRRPMVAAPSSSRPAGDGAAGGDLGRGWEEGRSRWGWQRWPMVVAGGGVRDGLLFSILFFIFKLG